MNATLPPPGAHLGLETLSRELAANYPDCTISRHALLRLCRAGHLPCMQLPPLTGNTPRYRVTLRDAVRTLRNLKNA